MKCGICGGLVEWKTLMLTETECRRCGEIDAHVDDEDEDETSDGGPTEADLQGEVEAAWSWLKASAGDWASADEDESNDGGPTQADLRGEVDHHG